MLVSRNLWEEYSLDYLANVHLIQSVEMRARIGVFRAFQSNKSSSDELSQGKTNGDLFT